MLLLVLTTHSQCSMEMLQDPKAQVLCDPIWIIKCIQLQKVSSLKSIEINVLDIFYLWFLTVFLCLIMLPALPGHSFPLQKNPFWWLDHSLPVHISQNNYLSLRIPKHFITNFEPKASARGNTKHDHTYDKLHSYFTCKEDLQLYINLKLMFCVHISRELSKDSPMRGSTSRSDLFGNNH